MAFFTEEERGSLRIRSMILHVVGGEEEFVLEAAREVEHENFFIARILDTDIAPIYEFLEHSATRDKLVEMAQNPAAFEIGAQSLSQQFSLLHVGAARDGAFFIFELESHTPDVTFYSLIKYDYREAIEQAADKGGSRLRRIVQAFIADRRAIQKAALIRITGGAADGGVTALDRVRPSPEISDYFEKFLGVKRARSNQELSVVVKDVFRKTLSESRELLPDQDVARAFNHAVTLLRDRRQINEDVIEETVIASAGNPEDEEIRTKLQNRVRRKLRQSKLDGLAFRPSLSVLRRPPHRRVKTTEGVLLVYPDEGTDNIVRRSRQPEGGEIITIRTARIEEDELVRDSAR